MGKRRIEQKLGTELWHLGFLFNEKCPRKTPGKGPTYQDLCRKDLCDKLWHEADSLCYKMDLKDWRLIIKEAHHIALLALLLADRARRDA